jgi:hypothetical protein
MPDRIMLKKPLNRATYDWKIREKLTQTGRNYTGLKLTLLFVEIMRNSAACEKGTLLCC